MTKEILFCDKIIGRCHARIVDSVPNGAKFLARFQDGRKIYAVYYVRYTWENPQFNYCAIRER